MPTYSIEGDDGRTYSIDGPAGATEDQVWAAIQYEIDNPPPPPRRADDGFFDVLGYGAESAINRAGATFDTLTGDLGGVEKSVLDAQKIPQTEGQKSFRADLNDQPEGGFTDEVVNLFNAVVDNPGGAWDELVGQLPNAVPAIGGLLAGAKAGSMAGATIGPVGATIGGVVGAGIGTFLGTASIEMGAMAQSKVGDDGFTPEDRMASITGGAAKSATIAGFDLLTLYSNKLLGGMPGKAAHKAVTKFLGEQGVDIASNAAVKTALANKAILTGAVDVAQKAVRSSAKTPGIVAGFVSESAGEGAGEYFGEMAAGNEPSMREALLEAGLAMPQSVVEETIGRSLATKPDTIQEISGQTPGQFEAEQLTGVTPPPIDALVTGTTPEQAAAFGQPVSPLTQPTAPIEPVTEQGKRENEYAPQITLTDTEKEAVLKEAAAAKVKAAVEAKVAQAPVEELPLVPEEMSDAETKAALKEFEDAESLEEFKTAQDELRKKAQATPLPTAQPTPPAAPVQPTPTEPITPDKLTDLGATETALVQETIDETPTVEPAGTGISVEDRAPDAGAGTAIPPVVTPAPLTEEPAPGGVGVPDVALDRDGVSEGDGAGTLAENPYETMEVEDDNWAFGKDEDGTFVATEEGFPTEIEAQEAATVQQVRDAEQTPAMQAAREALIDLGTKETPENKAKVRKALEVLGETDEAKGVVAAIPKTPVSAKTETPETEAAPAPEVEAVPKKPLPKKPKSAAKKPTTPIAEVDNLTAKKKAKRQAKLAEDYGTKLDAEADIADVVLSKEELEAKAEIEASPPISDEVKAQSKAMTTAQGDKIRVSGHTADISRVHYTTTNQTEPATVDDYKKVVTLLETTAKDRENDAVARGAHTYFNDNRRVIDNIEDVAHDLVYRYKKYSRPNINKVLASHLEPESIEEYNFHKQKGGEAARNAAKWIVKNMSLKAKKAFAKKLSAKSKEFVKVMNLDPETLTPMARTNAEQIEAQAKATAAFRAATLHLTEPSDVKTYEGDELAALIASDPEGFGAVTEALIKDGELSGLLELPLHAINASDLAIPPYAMRMLADGNLTGALAVIADSSPNALVGRYASEILKNIGTTKVKVLKDVKNASGKSVAGSFDPETNTIKIRAGDVPIHVLLHEGTHAVLSHTLANKSHPLTKKLNTLYENVKDDLSSEYGSESLQEFAAEALSNPRFQQELASLYAGKKSDLPAWRQFLDAITEFFTKLFNIKSTGTYAQFNDMLVGMMSPAPETRGAGELYMMSQMDEIDALVAEVGKGDDASLKAFKQRPAETALDAMNQTVFHDMSTLAKRGSFGFLQTVSMADYTSKFGIHGTKELHHLFQQVEAAITTGQHPLDGFVNKLNQWNKGGKLLRVMASDSQRAKTEIMNRALPEMTLYEVNGLYSEAEAKRKYKGDQDKLDKWAELQPAMETLGEDGRKIIQNYWDAFTHMKKELISGLESTINDAVKDPNIRKQLKEKVFKDLLSKANIDPYSPLWRTGKYWVEFIDRDNNENGTVYETYKTRSAQNARYDELAQLEESTKGDAGGSEVFAILQYEKPTLENFEKSPPTKFIKDSMDIFDKANVPSETKKLFMDLFIASLPETSFAKAFQKRKGSGGYEKDALGTFQHTAYGLNRQIQQLKYHKKIRKQLDVVHESAKEYNKAHQVESNFGQKRNTSAALVAEWDSRTKFALMPDANWQATASRWTNRFAFMWTIGFGPSSAIVNTGQLPMVVYPFQAIKTNPKTAYQAMSAAGRFVLGAGREHHVELLGTADHERFKHKGLAPSGDNYYVHDYATGELSLADANSIDDTKIYYDGYTKRGLTRLLLPLMKYMSDEGQLERTVAYDAMGVELSGKDKNIGEHVSIVGAWMFHTGERLNRQVAMIGAYLNELKKLEKETGKRPEDLSNDVLEKAMATALHDTQYTNGGSMLQTAPRWAQKNIGRVAMMYKSFGVSMYTLQGKLLHTALKDSEATKAEKIEAGSQFMAINGMVAAMSGLQGVTLYGMFAGLANLWPEALGGLGDDEEDFETHTRKAIGEFAYKGGVNYLTKILGGEGVDVAARIGLSNLILSHDRYNFDPSWEKGLVKMLGGPAYGSLTSIGRGIGYVGEGEYERGFEAMLPAGIRNMAKIVHPGGLGRYSKEGILTRRGDPIMGELGPGLLAAQFLGFAPAEYTRNQERSQSLKGIDRAVNERRTELLRRLYVTQRFGESTSDIMADINKFNQKHPQFAIDWKSVRDSLKKHVDTSQNMYNGILLSPRMRRHLFGLASEWDGGI